MDIPKSPDNTPRIGMWHSWRGRIVIVCPKCKTTGYLDHYEIADDGTVSPNVVCVTGGCGFHERLKLGGYHRDDVVLR